jgi:hypothetical protein
LVGLESSGRGVSLVRYAPMRICVYLYIHLIVCIKICNFGEVWYIYILVYTCIYSVCVYFYMDIYGFMAEGCIGWLRIVRPGSIIGTLRISISRNANIHMHFIHTKTSYINKYLHICIWTDIHISEKWCIYVCIYVYIIHICII